MASGVDCHALTMTMIQRATIACMALLSASLGGGLARAWSAGPTALVSEQQVAAALGGCTSECCLSLHIR